MNMTAFPDHGWRFGKPKAFYITIDDTLIRNSNDLGGKILREAGLDFEEWKDYDWIRNETYRYKFEGKFGGDVKEAGYAGYYLVRSWNMSKMINEADATVYQRLVEIDTTLGTELSLQLWNCLSWTTRWDIIKV